MTSRVLRIAAFALAAILPLIVLGFIVKLGINLPYLDEWEWTDLLYHEHAGTLTFAELWRPHNEHRIIVCNVVMLALARMGGWNIVREQIFGLAAVVATQGALWCVIRRTIDARVAPFAFAAVSCFLYSIGQVENFANGFQFGWPLCSFALAAAAVLLTSPARTWKHVTLAGIFATLASFSSSQGLLIWPVGVLWLLFAPARSPWTVALWLAWAAAVVALDRIGAAPAAWHATFRDAAGVAAFSLAYLGSPLAGWAGTAYAAVAGALTLAAFAAAAAFAVRRGGRSAFAAALPWFGFAAYAVLAAPVTAYARLDLGIGQALAARYVTISSMLDIALAALVVQSIALLRGTAPRVALWAALAATALTVVPASANGVRYWVWYTQARNVDLAAIARGEGAGLTDLYPNGSELARYLAELRALHDGLYRR